MIVFQSVVSVYGPSGVTSIGSCTTSVRKKMQRRVYFSWVGAEHMCHEKGVKVDPCHLLRVSLGLPFINHHLGCVF